MVPLVAAFGRKAKSLGRKFKHGFGNGNQNGHYSWHRFG
jgi:hypothetical protein